MLIKFNYSRALSPLFALKLAKKWNNFSSSAKVWFSRKLLNQSKGTRRVQFIVERGRELRGRMMRSTENTPDIAQSFYVNQCKQIVRWYLINSSMRTDILWKREKKSIKTYLHKYTTMNNSARAGWFWIKVNIQSIERAHSKNAYLLNNIAIDDGCFFVLSFNRILISNSR